VRVEQDEIAPKRRRIRYVAEPGVQAYFGPIEIVGNASVDANVVRRQLVYRPGQQFRLDQVRESQRQLYSLELFQFATIEPLDSGGATEVPTRVTVAEGDHRRVMFAGGWGAEEKLNGELAWRHVNFYGGARVLAASGKWSSLDRGGEVDFRQPYLFHPNLALALNGHAWFADELAYQARSEGGRATVEGRFSANTGWRATYTHEFASSQIMEAARADLTQRETLIALGLDPATGRQEGALSSLAFELQHATPDDPLNPRAGYSAALFAEQAGTVLAGTFNYTNVSADVRGFVPLGERVVLSGRLHGAFIDPAGTPDDVPFFKRYFLGGSTSLRGWGRFEISPLSSSGLPLGGFSLFEATAEVRARLWGNLGAAVFVDGGNVWSDAWTLRPGDLRYDAGPGLLYLTPIGPLRVDFGYQLTPVQGLIVDGQPASRRWRIHFRIGQE
jgi:outer membrane protein insertion porin family/translocation and assembly module TamA